jgi:hypothetical protein
VGVWARADHAQDLREDLGLAARRWPASSQQRDDEPLWL